MSFQFNAGGKADESLDNQTAYINERRPDIVFLQEIDIDVDRAKDVEIRPPRLPLIGRPWGRNKSGNQPAQLATRCNISYWAFGADKDLHGGQVGQAILSKFPLRNVRNHRIPGRNILEVEAVIFGVPHRLLCTHFVPNMGRPEQEDQYRSAQILIKLCNEYQGPVIFGGDFNTGRSGPTYDFLTGPENKYDSLKAAPQGSYHCDEKLEFVGLRRKAVPYGQLYHFAMVIGH